MIFKDLVVVELASVLAGPLTGTFFSELGARVIKIENRNTGGDVTRKWKLPQEDPESSVSAYYASANYNKESILLNFKDKEDFNALITLIADCDIVIANFKGGSAAKLGLDYDSLKKINPNLIYASLTGYGEESNRPAFDMVLQAETGFMSMTGEPDGPPCKIPVAIIDVLAAHHMKQAILCALIEKQKTGRGKFISVCLKDAATAALVNQATNYLMVGKVAERMGSQHPNIAPYGDTFRTCDDRFIMLAIGTDAQFAHLCSLLKINKVLFETNVKRLQKRHMLNQLIADEIKTKGFDYWQTEFNNMGIPYSKINSVAEHLNQEDVRKDLLRESIEGVDTIRPRTALI